MIGRVPALFATGALVAGLAAPQYASAHGSDDLLVFAAGAAVGYLLTADDDHHRGRHQHRHGHPEQAYVLVDDRGWYAPPPVRVVHYAVEPPRYVYARPGPEHRHRHRRHSDHGYYRR